MAVSIERREEVKYPAVHPYLKGLNNWDDAEAALITSQADSSPDGRKSRAILKAIFRRPSLAPADWGQRISLVEEDIDFIRRSQYLDIIGVGSFISGANRVKYTTAEWEQNHAIGIKDVA